MTIKERAKVIRMNINFSNIQKALLLTNRYKNELKNKENKVPNIQIPHNAYSKDDLIRIQRYGDILS